MSGIFKLLYGLGVVFSLAACQSVIGQSAATCRPLGHDKEALLSLKAANFEIADIRQRQRFALQLVDCLGDPDPQLRDGVAYEAFVGLLRGTKLESTTIAQLRSALLDILAGPDDRSGFRKPFAALTLAEVARADRLQSLFTTQERSEIVDTAIGYMNGITDYRGYDETDGWRHAVAHTADLFLQLVVNPAVTPPQLERIANALVTQIAPAGEHFYIYGEYERLARPVYFIAMRGELSDRQWADWFARLASPAPFADWSEVWASQAGLAKLHNTKVFAGTLYTFANADEAPQLKPLADGALALLKSLP